MDFSDQIREKRLREIDDLERTERLKLRLCINSTKVFDIIMSNYADVSERISLMLDLDQRDKELLSLIRVVDLDLQKIGDTILKLKEKRKFYE